VNPLLGRLSGFGLALAALCGLFLAAPPAQALEVTYEVRDLHFEGPAGQNSQPLPLDLLCAGICGHFTWTYAANDFAGGSGQLIDLKLPITSLPLAMVTTSVGLAGLSGTHPGDSQTPNYDWSIVFAQTLQGPGQSTTVNPSSSSFSLSGIYQGSSYYSEWTGHITGGTIAPAAVPESSASAMLLLGLLFLSAAATRDRPTRPGGPA
jgi:hypothetical protein